MRPLVDRVLAALLAAGMSLGCRQGPTDAPVTTARDDSQELVGTERAAFTFAARGSAPQGESGRSRRLESLLPVHLGEPWAEARRRLLQVGSECSDWTTPEERFVECRIKPDEHQVLDGFYRCRAGSVDGRTVNRINVSAAR